MVTLPMTTLDELMSGLPPAFRRIFLEQLLPSRRRSTNAARSATTRELLVLASTPAGIPATLDLAHMFNDNYMAAERSAHHSSMNQQKPIQEYAGTFKGSVVGAMKRALPRLSKVRDLLFASGSQRPCSMYSPLSAQLWVQSVIEADAHGVVRPDIVRGLVNLVSRAVTGFPGSFAAVVRSSNSDVDVALQDGADDEDDESDLDLDDDADPEAREEAMRLRAAELAARKDFTTDPARLRARLDRIFAGKVLTPAEVAFRNTFSIGTIGRTTKAWVAAMRVRYLHPTLIASGLYPIDGSATDMGRVVTGANIGRVLQFTYDMNLSAVQANPANSRGIPQLLCPSPSLAGGFLPETATTFAAMVCEAIKMVKEDDAAYGELRGYLESVAELAIQDGCAAMGLQPPSLDLMISRRIKLYNDMRTEWFAEDQRDTIGLRRYIDVSSFRNPMVHPMSIPALFQAQKMAEGFGLYGKHQAFLFYAFMPGVEGFFAARWRSGQPMWFKHSFCTDGHGVRLQAYNLLSHTARELTAFPMGGSDRARASRLKVSEPSVCVTGVAKAD